MKRNRLVFCIVAAFVALLSSVSASAQELLPPEGYEYVDSLVYVQTAQVDTTLVGKDVFLDMPSAAAGDDATVRVNQSSMVEQSMRSHIAANEKRNLSGYRVRIFFDNKQSARVESEKTLKTFMAVYHDIPAYRTYTNPYFKVTVGDCRTKSEANALLTRIKGNFPSAFVVKENIRYPIVDKNNAVTEQVIKVLRPIAEQ